MRIVLFFIFCALPTLLLANMRQYSASVEDADWVVAKKTKLKCELSHPIPGYGEAKFVTEASKQLNLEFVLDMLRLPNRYDKATVYSVPPAWMPGGMQRVIGEMDLRKQYDGDLPSVEAWEMLTELEKGYWPTIYYQDWNNSRDAVAVGLNASNFTQPYYEFADCVANLLPYSFEDIAYTVLSYKKGGVELTKYAKRRLDMIGDYLKEDPELELVLLDGYSDAYGTSSRNMELSRNRAREIKDYFAAQGVDDTRIDITANGERRHIAPNDTELGRAKNRRVVVRMAKM